MTPLENLHSAIGELAYAMVRAGRPIQREEAAKFLNIVTAELDNKNYSFDVDQIVFNMMIRAKMDTKTTYIRTVNKIKTNSHCLSPRLKEKFINVMEKVANAFPPVTSEEKDLVERFKKDMAPLKRW